MNIKIALYIVVGIAALAAAFVGGGYYVGSVWGMTDPFRISKGPSFGSTLGVLVAKDGNTLVIGLPNGETKTVLLGERVNVQIGHTGTVDDIQLDSYVSVSGTMDSDGTITAQTVRVTPVSAGATTTSERVPVPTPRQ
jgi:hypothetical protein